MSEIQRVFGEDARTHEVTVYVPSTLDVSVALSEDAADALVNRTLRFMSRAFGGATAIQAKGAWFSDTGELVQENVTLVYSATDTLARNKLKAVRNFALAIKSEYGQMAVTVAVDGMLYLVS